MTQMLDQKHDHALVTLAGDGYLDAAKQMFASATVNGGWSGDRVLLTDSGDERALDEFREAGVRIMDSSLPPELLSPRSGSQCESWNDSILMKLSLFRNELKVWKKILYLDTDIIVKGRLDKLCRRAGFWAASDFAHFMRNQFVDGAPLLEMGINPRDHSFNSGVMCLDQGSMDPNTFEQIINLAAKHRPNFRFNDQPALNLHFYGRWQRLPQAYNFFPIHMPWEPLLNAGTASILHFVSEPKPWRPESTYQPQWQRNLEMFGRESEFHSTTCPRLRECLAPLSRFTFWAARRMVRRHCPGLYERCRRATGHRPSSD